MTDSSLVCSVCDKESDSMGDHAMGCGGNGDRISRHDAIREILFSSTQSAGLAPRREVPSIIPNSSSRPADIYLPFWSGGRPAALDVTVISPLQKSTITASSSSQGAALTVVETIERMLPISLIAGALVSPSCPWRLRHLVVGAGMLYLLSGQLDISMPFV